MLRFALVNTKTQLFLFLDWTKPLFLIGSNHLLETGFCYGIPTQL